MRDSLAAWQLRVPQLRARLGRPRARLLASRSRDLAALRIRAKDNGRVAVGLLPAAGMPWFMTVFGRDTIITCLQTMLFGPELARSVARRARRAAGDRGRPGARRRAGEDRPRGAARQGCRSPGSRATTARSTRRRSISSCSRRSGAGRTTRALVTKLREPAMRGARVDRRVRRPRRRRLRRVRAALAARARGPVVEGLARLAALRRRPGGASRRSRRARCRATSTTRSAHGRGRARGVARPRARRPARARGGRAAAGVRRGVLGRGARRLLRARARRREAAASTRSCSNMGHLLWSGIVPLGARRRRRRPADGRGALVGLGRAHDVVRRRGLQPARVPQRHRLAPRQLADRAAGSRGTALAGGAADRAPHVEAAAYFDCQLPEVFAGHGARRDAVPDRLSDRGAAAGVGGRRRRCCCCACCSASSPTADRHTARDGRAVELPSWAGELRLAGRAVRSTDAGTCASRAARCAWRPRMKIAVVAPCGSRCRRPATAASSGSSGCSPRASSRRATT